MVLPTYCTVLVRIDLGRLFRLYLRLIGTMTRFKPEKSTMQEVAHQQRSFHSFNEADADEQLKRELYSLEGENSRLKELIVRLSETIIKNVVAKR